MATAIRGYKNQKRIMKKEYIKPEIFVEEILLEGMLATSVPVNEEESDEFDAPGRQDRRGRWGNLWSQD